MHRRMHDQPMVYLDSAATSHKPKPVIEAITDYYERLNSNVHRGSYQLAVEATEALEQARKKVAQFIGASSDAEVIFTKNATEAINLVARTWGYANLGHGDPVVITELEHHANIVPWQMLVEDRGIELRWIPIDCHGHLDLTNLDRLLDGAKLLSVAAVSNVLSTINPVRQLADAAHNAGALMLVDASQHTPHLPTDVGEMNADFIAFTGHKMCGPTGIGVLWGRLDLLEAIPPFLGGGEMILNVTKEGFSTAEVPWKFEAGTPPIAEAVGLGAAVDYLSALGMPQVRVHEMSLTEYALRTLKGRYGDSITIHGPSEPAERSGVLSFEYKSVHPHDVAQILDRAGICVRAGHHCAKPLMRVLGCAATSRASIYVYNDESDVDALTDALGEADAFFVK
ncbi:MAG: SufS family cysteine desulfurase [Acidimicrobiia bacterium]|nr:SufS family cysteine desulfurase [Acidimicrobiia bacterium]MYC58360.1 SufS family cysteine desulfurase [Acidimicrobiia bacterium]MYG94119.1 SufS family cysteine desulfurase [Acidimicrobiia bacterium]MYI30534.1 SufS family cysteine desulfurase [Acidimicrobiia bacterium]